MKQNKRSRATGVQTEQTPRRPLSAAKKVLIVSMCLLATVTGILATAVGYAYFTKEEIYDAYFGASMGELFDHLSPDGGLTAYQTYLQNKYAEAGQTVTPPEDPAWGSEWNPYVISEGKHLNNLSQLQNIGYFDKHYISHNYNVDANGQRTTYKTESKEMPYFLVCTPEGKPVCIEGANEMIKPIGTEEYPFIGSIQGAFLDGTCTVDGKSSDVSVLHDVNIASTVDSVDVGLFAHISFLGDMESAGKNEGYFQGYVSEISDLLLYDVTVTVDRESWLDVIWKAIEENEHIFTFNMPNQTQTGGPHETNHLGIFAGHVTYSRVELISVYYSATDNLAIDLSHTQKDGETVANYMSSTGIIGFLHGLNPEIGPNGEIKEDSGVSNNGIQLGTTTGGGGGGALSGDMRGYVIAKNVYERFKYDNQKVADTDGSILIKDAYDEDGNRLVQEEVRNDLINGEVTTGNYYFYDGVFTFALSSDGNDQIAPTWPGDIPNFVVGADSDTAWRLPPDTAAAQESVVAYLKQIKTNADLKNYVENPTKKNQLVITAELGNGAVYMMSLATPSTAGATTLDPDQMYTTKGQHLSYASTALLDELKQYYLGSVGPVPDGIVDANGNKLTGSAFASQLGTADGYQVIELGKVNSNAGITTEKLNQAYKITGNVAKEGEVEQYAYYESSTGMAMPGFNPTQKVSESLRYGPDANKSTMTVGTIECGGYFYVKEQSSTGYYKQLCWQPFEGGSEDLWKFQNWISDSTWTIQDFFDGSFTKTGTGSSTSASWQGETVYSFTKAGSSTTYYGIVLDFSNGEHFTSSGKPAATLQGTSLYKYIQTDYYAFVSEGGVGTYKYQNIGEGVTITAKTGTGSTSPGGIQLYTDGTRTGFAVDRYPQFVFSSGVNTMQLLSVNYHKASSGADWASDRMFYMLYNGRTPAPSGLQNSTNYGTPTSVASTSFASVKFNTDGTCSIFYTNEADNAMRYINYGGDCFNGTASVPTIKFKMYVLEATKEGANASGGSGEPTIVPAVDATFTEYAANQWVLYAGSSQGNANNAPNKTFELKQLNDLGWKDDNGNVLAGSDKLLKKFKMTEGIEGGTALDLWGILNTNDGPLITAPVGTYGFNANIPKSCIAFRLNEDATTAQTIRVIVAVPTSYVFPGSDTSKFSANTNCFFNLWFLNEAGWQEADQDQFVPTQTFDPAATKDRFYLPQSHPYTSTSTPANSSYIEIGKNQRAYLNGNQVLVAYEFTMQEAGIYLLGATGFDATTNTNIPVPTQIVYFSADGAASEGQDGTVITGAQLGTIDFVYDYGNAVITVKDTAGVPGGSNTPGRNYNYYYPSYALLYFDNRLKTGEGDTADYIRIIEAGVRLRRTAGATVNDNATITYSRKYTAELGEYIRVTSYAAGTFSDTLTPQDSAWVEPAS